MTISLKLLFEEIYQTKDEDDLRLQLAPQIGEYFSAKRSAIFFFDRLKVVGAASSVENRRFQKILNVALSLEHNPVARYLGSWIK